MKKELNLGFGLIPAIIIIAIAIALGMGAQKLIDSRVTPTDTATTTDQTSQTDTQTSSPKSYIPGVDPVPSGQDPVPDTSNDQPVVSTQGLHQSCKNGVVCAQGQECVRYYGYAGPSGQSFATCEIPCKTNNDCPGTLSCGNYADGPGYVCSQF
jgi:hypothetical protein